MSIVFDFDGTIAKTTPYHRSGWELAIQELGLKKDLNELLPYEPNLMERFDSYRRIRAGFLADPNIKSKISKYFSEEDDEILTKKIMSLKESLTINTIFKENATETLKNLGVNLLGALGVLKESNLAIGIISSSRETVINSFLYKCGIIDLFDFVIGEESLTAHDGTLFDKPNPYAKKVLDKMAQSMKIYVGDNESIDKEFAEVCGSRYIYASYESNFLDIVRSL